MSIKPLPDDVIAQIKSSTTVTSLNGVIAGLMKNSLDAGSARVDISVDYGRGGCVVEDNGLGILPSEFGVDGGLGKLYHSSKLNSPTAVHGVRGSFLTYLGAMSLVTITSHHHEYRSHNTLSMHKSEVVSRQVPAPTLQHLSHSGHGTRVTVRNLFGNMPVRVKQRVVASERQGRREWESLKSCIVLLCLAWPNGITVALRELATNQRMIIRDSSKYGPKMESSRVCSILSQSSLIALEEKASWVSVGASTSSLDVSGAISLDPSPTKFIQFISFEIQPISATEGQSILHDEINQLFTNSAFGNEEEAEGLDELEKARRASDARYKGNGYTNKELKGGRKGVDRWPMFYLNVQGTNPSGGSKSFDVGEILDNKGNSLNAVIELLRALILEFLTKHHFRPKAARSQRAKGWSEENGTPNVERTETLPDCEMTTFARSPATGKASPMGSKLRKRKSATARNSDPDLLGTNVKLPSFRHSSTFDSPFDAWSRIKSGKNKSSCKNAGNVSAASTIRRPSTVPPSILVPVAISNSLPRSTPLVSSSGRVPRRPFDDVSAGNVRLRSNHLRTLTARCPESKLVPIDLTRDNEGIVAWINPITKVESVVNKGTGHTVPLSQTLPSPEVSLCQRIPSDIRFTPQQPSSWVSNLLERWENPVFRPTEPSILQVSPDAEAEHIPYGQRHKCTRLDINRALTKPSSGIRGRIPKQTLRDAEVIGQVDRKFILVKLFSSEKTLGDGKVLAIIDQHAADERIRVESLLEELCKPCVDNLEGMHSISGVVTMRLEKGFVFEASEKDIELLRMEKAHFAEWGICYDLPSESQSIEGSQSEMVFTVRSLPPSIVERCKTDPKLLIELIRTEIYSNFGPSHSHNKFSTLETNSKDWLKRIHQCPQGLLNMVNSRACRSAMMFNDDLNRDQCEVLVRKLADTAFPFQCAHGRPSLLPLVELGDFGLGVGGEKQSGEGFGKAFRKWKLSGP